MRLACVDGVVRVDVCGPCRVVGDCGEVGGCDLKVEYGHVERTCGVLGLGETAVPAPRVEGGA